MTAGLLGLALFVGSTQAMAAANFVLVNLDGAGEGFNDPTVVAAVAGNPGTTLGQQRQNVFNAAMSVWGATLNSNVDIRVGAQFDSQFCSATSATLGSAGPTTAHRTFSGSLANTWYGQALANSLAGVDLSGNDDINATFNSNLDSDPACLGGAGWDYRIPSAASALSLYSVVLHELGHGLNFLTFVDTGTGTRLGGIPDIFMTFLFDQGTNTAWTAMTDAQRAASVIGGNLFWTGANARTAGTDLPLTSGQDGVTGNVEMFAPNPLRQGSSVSHWDTGLTPNELMEPFSTANPLRALTIGAFVDMGWTLDVPQADLSVGKVANPDPVTAGDALTYTITVDNAGPNDAENVVVTDTLPGCVTLTSTTGCNEDPNGVADCSLGLVAAGTMASYEILVDTTGCPAGAMRNLASVSSDTDDPNPGNNSTNLFTNVGAPPVPEANLSVTLSDSEDPIMAGRSLRYDVDVANAGPDIADSVQVSTTLPIGVGFDRTQGCNNDPNGVPTCDLGNLNAGGAVTPFSIFVTVATTTSGVISNVVTVSSATNDPGAGNNQAIEETTISPYGDIDLDDCIGRNDIRQLVLGLRGGSADPVWDFNGDGHGSRADARTLVPLYTNPRGVCP